MPAAKVKCPKCDYIFDVNVDGDGSDIDTHCPKCDEPVFGTAHDFEQVGLSEDARTVLDKMRLGCVLVGSIGDYCRGFRLEHEGGDSWDNVRHAIVKELLDGAQIKVARDRGNGQEEYRAIEA